MAKRRRQIGWADEHTIHAFGIGNGLQVVQGLHGFGLHQQANLGIGLFGVVGVAAPARCACAAHATDTALAIILRIAHGFDDGCGLFARVHHGHQQGLQT